MKPKPNLEAPILHALRRRIAKQERFAPKRRALPSGIISLGAAALDDALPDQGLRAGALHEFQPAAHGDLAATVGFAIGLLVCILRTQPGFVLWTEAAHQAFRDGALYPLGLAAMGADPDRVIEARGPKSKDILWALEKGLENAALTAVIGVLPENDRAYDFTASRRLAMRAAENGATALLIRSTTLSDISTAAETRWSVAAAPSAPQHRVAGTIAGVGVPCWRLDLTKSRRGTPGSWRVEWDEETLSFRLAALLADRAPVQAARRAEQGWACAS